MNNRAKPVLSGIMRRVDQKSLAASGCSLLILIGSLSCNQEIREEKSISDFTVAGDSLYFGGGYQLYRLDLRTQLLQMVYRTDRIRVDQPLIQGETAYFGGGSCDNRWGLAGEDDAFFALDLPSRKLRWRFAFDHGPREPFLRDINKRTWGTYPVIAGDRVIVCASQHMDCLDRADGRLIWHVRGWFGFQTDWLTRPYVRDGFVSYKIHDGVPDSSEPGDWAVQDLKDGRRLGTIPPGVQAGGNSVEADRANRNQIDDLIYVESRWGRFGALDLGGKKFIWEFDLQPGRRSQFSIYGPAVNDGAVFTSTRDLIYAFDRRTGRVKWKSALGEVLPTEDVPGFVYRPDGSLVRFTATSKIVIARGCGGIAGYDAETGELIWSVKSEADLDDAAPVTTAGTVIVSCAKQSRVFALDLKTGRELWSVHIPDCTVYRMVDK